MTLISGRRVARDAGDDVVADAPDRFSRKAGRGPGGGRAEAGRRPGGGRAEAGRGPGGGRGGGGGGAGRGRGGGRPAAGGGPGGGWAEGRLERGWRSLPILA